MCHGTTLLRFIKQMKIMFLYAFFWCRLLAKLVAGMINVSRMGMKRWLTNLLCNYSDLLVCSRCLAAVDRAAEGKDVINYDVKVCVIFNKPDIFEAHSKTGFKLNYPSLFTKYKIMNDGTQPWKEEHHHLPHLHLVVYSKKRTNEEQAVPVYHTRANNTQAEYWQNPS